MGRSDTTIYGTTDFYETPNIERLAKRGMKFYNAYTASPICSPTRASILTEQYPARLGITQAQRHLEDAWLKAGLVEKAEPDKKVLKVLTANRLQLSILRWLRRLKRLEMQQGFSANGIWYGSYTVHSKKALIMKSIILFKLLFVLFLLNFSSTAQEMPTTFKNPIIHGFYPDLSICRVGEFYYLVTSSFEWLPGVPIFCSKDLINWEQIRRMLDRHSQLNIYDGGGIYGRIWACTIRYHNGKFYMITTAQRCGGNFYVTAADPAKS